MKTLLVSAYGPPFALGLGEGKILLSKRQGDGSSPLSEVLLPNLKALLEENNISSPDAVALIVGPGSMTSLRIGISTVKALVKVWQVPVYGFNSLEALAFEHLEEGYQVWPFIESIRGEVYGALYEGAPPREEVLLPPQVFSVKTLLEKIKQDPHPKKILGSALNFYPELLEYSTLKEGPEVHVQFSLSSFLKLFNYGFSQGRVPLSNLKPFYLSEPQAEKKLNINLK